MIANFIIQNKNINLPIKIVLQCVEKKLQDTRNTSPDSGQSSGSNVTRSGFVQRESSQNQKWKGIVKNNKKKIRNNGQMQLQIKPI